MLYEKIEMKGLEVDVKHEFHGSLFILFIFILFLIIGIFLVYDGKKYIYICRHETWVTPNFDLRFQFKFVIENILPFLI